MLTNLKKKALKMLINNKRVKNTPYTPPSPSHYPNGYLWDSDFVAIVLANLGEPEKAADELEQVLSWQDKKTGFIPNMKLGRGRFIDPELLSFKNSKFGSDYTQPPLHAKAAWGIYEADKKIGLKFLKKNYDSLALSYEYFLNFRQNGKGEKLIGVIHPHETGRDSDPTFDFAKMRLPSNFKFANTFFDYAGALRINFRLKGANWDLKKIRNKKIFWVNDVMFNCTVADNLFYMSKIANSLNKKSDEKKFEKEADELASEIFKDLWDEKDKMFYAKNMDGKFIKVISISNLAPIMLQNITVAQVEKILELLEDKSWFNTPFPIPSVPANSKKFDSHYKEKRLWRGPVWINTNWMIINGLFEQAKRFKKINPKLSKKLSDRAEIISKKTRELAENGFWEFYDPYSGKGMRIKDFAWSTLASIV